MSGDHNQYQKATGCEMNTDLIRRLEKQCWNYQANCVDAEKFAQLIVAECCVALHPMLRDMISRTQGVDMIVKHFGVEL